MAGSSLFENKRQFKIYRYHVQALQFVIPNKETIDFPTERLLAFSIAHDYERNAFPLFKISMTMEPTRYYKILEAKNTGYLYLRVDMYYHYLDDNSPSVYRAAINDNFDLIMDEGTDDMLAGQKRNEWSSDFTSIKRNEINNLKDTENAVLTTYLFKSSIVSGTKANIATVLQKATVTDAIGYCMTKAGIKNLIMAKSDNNTVYNELLLPPLTVTKELQFIDTYYGIYKKGSMIYFGLKYSYIIPYDGGCSAYTDGSNTVISILIPESNNTHTSTSGMLESGVENHRYIVGDFRTIDITNSDISSNLLQGNNMIAIDGYSGQSAVGQSKTGGRDGTSVNRYQVNNTENPFYTEMYTTQTAAMGSVIKIRLNNIDFLPLEPNCRYSIVFEDASYARKYSGDYVLAAVVHNFIRDGDDLAINSVAEFKRSK